MVRNGTSAKAPVLWQTWFTMALIGVFVGITMTLDMFLALAVTLFCLSITFGQRRYWAAALVAVITPLIIFFAFDLGFGIRFPRGILTELYY